MLLQFSDADDFKATNAKFSLNMALAFSNANALRKWKRNLKNVGPFCCKDEYLLEEFLGIV